MKNLFKNIYQGWITTILGIILLVSVIGSIYQEASTVTWTDAALPLFLSLMLILTPKDAKEQLRKKFGTGHTPLLLLLLLLFASCTGNKEVQQSQELKSTQTVSQVVKHHFKADSTGLEIDLSEVTDLENGYELRSESENTVVTAKMENGKLKIKAKAKERTAIDTVKTTFEQKFTIPAPDPAKVGAIKPGQDRSSTGWVFHNILLPIVLLAVSCFILICLGYFLWHLFRSLFITPSTPQQNE